MANTKTRLELQAELDEANERIEELETRLEEIVNIADAEGDDYEDDPAEDEDEADERD